jgi:hypothetical protein
MSTLSTPATLEYYDELARALPAPIPDKPEHRQRRLGTAIEAFQDLHPTTPTKGASPCRSCCAVIDALVRGTSDVLTTLDAIGGEDLDEAA